MGNSEFVMCNWQYELWLVTIYSVILHVLLSVNSGHAKYTSMAFFSKKNWWSWALGLRSLYIYQVHINGMRTYLELFDGIMVLIFFCQRGECILYTYLGLIATLCFFCFWLHNMFLSLFLFSLSSSFIFILNFRHFFLGIFSNVYRLKKVPI